MLPVEGYPMLMAISVEGLESGLVLQTRELPAKIKNDLNPPAEDSAGNVGLELREPIWFPEISTVPYGSNPENIDDGIPCLSRVLSNKSRSIKSKQAAFAKNKLK
ncbi:hypothetical protein F3Y22_tig00111095pilonHSYRG00576 [Hibiscus syriacus]|uniref:Uncharacterized protein n=1 Tax=Hibiscus syriacus TaxID=106335 RepID=A0A6A2Z3M5_HIBSY|nr:hypothetical protein F3Y22_tig00111095pilonHSYRG00576 [Hibiscus syriacus]